MWSRWVYPEDSLFLLFSFVIPVGVYLNKLFLLNDIVRFLIQCEILIVYRGMQYFCILAFCVEYLELMKVVTIAKMCHSLNLNVEEFCTYIISSPPLAIAVFNQIYFSIENLLPRSSVIVVGSWIFALFLPTAPNCLFSFLKTWTINYKLENVFFHWMNIKF